MPRPAICGPTVIALGANLPSEQGAPLETLEAALSLLEARGVRIEARSRWFSSPAWPEGAGPDYVNGAATVTTAMTPQRLLEMLHKTETMLGRKRGPDRWGARPCDLDLICHGAMVAQGTVSWKRVVKAAPDTPRSDLVLPHPQMHLRAFVLAPMAEVAPDWRHPVLGQSVNEMLAALPASDREAVKPL